MNGCDIMERAMSVEERIRRAEERYNRKNRIQGNLNNGRYEKEYRNRYLEKNSSTSKKGSIKKLFMQMFICLSIYAFFYVASNSEYIFSDNFKNDVSALFTEKANIFDKYSSFKSFINEKVLNNDVNNSSENNEEIQKNENKEEKKSNDEEKKTERDNGENETNIDGKGLGGSEDEKSEKNNETETTQMQKDAEIIKSTISFIKPVEGRITSTFGWRNPSISTVPKYHTGTDIAVAEGTKIKSATNGKIILASSEGDYGNHYQIQINDVIIIYAHCKVLYLKEGDNVTQGQEIAEVGSTGNSTGPHLHFEVRFQERKVDPQLILDL